MQAGASANQIGIPLDTVSCFVISSNYDHKDPSSFAVVPVGEVGELVVGGYQNAVGYLNRPEQTTSAFIDSPFGPVYRTGDLARVRDDGTLECLGRMSEGQVKLRGQRIELGEVEHAALRVRRCHGAVAAVINNILVLFCAVDPGEDIPSIEAAIRQKCSEWLPAFMVPGDVVIMHHFPRLQSGKVDRKHLKAEYLRSIAEGQSNGEGTEEASPELSKKILSAIAAIVFVEIGPKTVLASAGLDSLGAIRLASRLRKENIAITANEILKARTAEDICRIASATVDPSVIGMTRGSPLPAPSSLYKDISTIIENHNILQEIRDEVVSILPCTDLQSSMLVETSYNSTMYCNVVELGFPESMRPSDVATEFLKLSAANEILRTGFIHHNGEFLQVVLKGLQDSQVAIVDNFEPNFELREDLDFIRPLRLQILGNSDYAPRALLHLHHSIYDGWSFDMLLSDWASLLQGRGLSPRPQFSNMVAFVHNIPEKDYEVSKRFWAEQLTGWEKTPLPRLSGRVPESDTSVLISRANLDVNRDAVMAVAKDLGCSPQVLFQAALLWLWSAVIGSADVVIGSVTSGRTIGLPEVERIIGPCIASMPLRANLANAATVRDLLKFVQASNRSIIQHALLPLAEIKKLTTLTGQQSLYDVLFVFQESLESNSADEDAVKQISHADMLETPILIEVEPHCDGYSIQLTYHPHVFEPALAEIFVRELDQTVQSLIRDTSVSLTSVRDCFTADLLSIHNPQVQRYAGSQDLAGVVEATIEKTPDKQAVHFARSISGDQGPSDVETLSFGELNSLANQIANWIRHVDPDGQDSVAAIIMDKSALFYASVLGILKTGRPYLPVLPSTPVKRIHAILEQSQASICLTDDAYYPTVQPEHENIVFNVQQADLGTFTRDNVKRPIDGSRPAYVIYTSGTTGTPKGVVLTTLNIVSHLDILERLYPVGESSRLLQSCSQAFDVSVFEIFFAWKSGMCLCSATNDVLFEDLEHAIRVLDITHLSMTPTVASLVKRDAVPNVQFLVTAGEAMTQAVFREWKGVLYQGK